MFTVTLSIYSRSYEMLDPPFMIKKSIQICENLKQAPDFKTEFISIS